MELDNKHKLLDLLLMHKEELLYTVQKRHDTSTNNKALHQQLIDVLSSDEFQPLHAYKVIFEPQYFSKPLQSLIFCMPIETEHKHYLLQAYNSISRGKHL